MIAYPVRASGDGTERIIDAAGHVLGTVEIVEALNAAGEAVDLRRQAEAADETGAWRRL